MSSRNTTGRAQALSVFDRPLVRAVLLVSIAFAAVVLSITTSSAAFASDCGTNGIDCVIPDTVDFSILAVAQKIIMVVFNFLMVVAAIVSLFFSIVSLVGLIGAVRSGNKDELRKQLFVLIVSLAVLVLSATGTWFLILKEIIDQGASQIA